MKTRVTVTARTDGKAAFTVPGRQRTENVLRMPLHISLHDRQSSRSHGRFGGRRLAEARRLATRLTSVARPLDSNVPLNPEHDMAGVEVVAKEPFLLHPCNFSGIAP